MMRSAWMVVPAVLAAGCSALFVSGPPAERPLPPDADCTESNFWPTIDLAGAGLFGLTSLVLFDLDHSAHSQDTKSGLVAGGIIYGALALAIGYSSLRGFAKTSSCREALAQPPPRPAPPLVYPPPASPPSAPPSGYPPPAYAPPADSPPTDLGPRYYPTPTSPPSPR